MPDVIDKFIKATNWRVGNFDMLPIVFGVVMAVVDIVMMALLKMVSTGAVSYGIGFPIATVLYALEPFVFLKALAHSNMTVTNLIWNLMSDVLVTLNGVIVFGESIHGLRWLAICMSIFSLGLFAYTDT